MVFILELFFSLKFLHQGLVDSMNMAMKRLRKYWKKSIGSHSLCFSYISSVPLFSIVEECSSPQAFFILHSTSGGTGSGLGTRIGDELRQRYEEVCFTVSLISASTLYIFRSQPFTLLSSRPIQQLHQMKPPLQLLDLV